MLGDGHAAGGDDDGGGGRDVEAVLAVAAGADDVDGIGRVRAGDLAGAQRAGGGDDFGDGFAAVGKRDQEAGERRRHRLSPSRMRAKAASAASSASGCAGSGRRHAGTFGRMPASVEEIGEQRMAMLGGDAFRVELDAVEGQFLVPHAHDQPFGAGGVDGEAIGQILGADDQRMVARGLIGRGQAGEDAGAIMA